MGLRKGVLQYGKIIIGSALIAAALQFFLIPNQVVVGGASGLATILSYLTGITPGVLLILVNAPLFIMALLMLGRGFVLRALLGIVVTSVLVDVFAFLHLVVTEDLLLVAVYSGILVGVGLGLVLSAGASVGGTDLAARLIRKKRPTMTIGRLILIIDAIIVFSGSFIFGSFDLALYAVIAIYILNRIVDMMLYGTNAAKVAHIISDQGPAIRELLIRDLGLKVTVLKGEGGGSGTEKPVFVCAIRKKQQVADLKRLVYTQDPAAFLMIYEAKEVFGRGFGDGLKDD